MCTLCVAGGVGSFVAPVGPLCFVSIGNQRSSICPSVLSPLSVDWSVLLSVDVGNQSQLIGGPNTRSRVLTEVWISRLYPARTELNRIECCNELN